MGKAHEECASCRARIWIVMQPSFAIEGDRLLCWGCAIERGGVYDINEGWWVTAPDTADLLDELVEQRT
jgi:hypothetical protein